MGVALLQNLKPLELVDTLAVVRDFNGNEVSTVTEAVQWRFLWERGYRGVTFGEEGKCPFYKKWV